VFDAFFMLDADVYFVNAFYQLRSTEALAQALTQGLDANPALGRERVVVRIRGVRQETSQEIIEAADCFYSPSLKEASERVLAVARSRVGRN
jgi:succinyl-CoA synthetase beta subunit